MPHDSLFTLMVREQVVAFSITQTKVIGGRGMCDIVDLNHPPAVRRPACHAEEGVDGPPRTDTVALRYWP
jgi:hypothetical protein